MTGLSPPKVRDGPPRRTKDRSRRPAKVTAGERGMRRVGAASEQPRRSLRRAVVALSSVVVALSSALAFFAPARAEDPGMKVVGIMDTLPGVHNGADGTVAV